MKAFYETTTIGDGLALETGYRPDLPAGYGGWVACSDPQATPTVTVLVAGDTAYHDALRANPSVVWIADAGSRPPDLPLPAAHHAKARAFFQARYGRPVLPPGTVTQRQALDLVLALHGRAWGDIDGNDVSA